MGSAAGTNPNACATNATAPDPRVMTRVDFDIESLLIGGRLSLPYM
jgi:hypothetical protein